MLSWAHEEIHRSWLLNVPRSVGVSVVWLSVTFATMPEAGVIPEDKIGNFGGSWSALSDAGEATNLNLVHKKGVEGEFEGRKLKTGSKSNQAKILVRAVLSI